MREVFDFVECADPEHLMRWNIESKIDAAFPDRTASVDVFVQKQHEVFAASPYRDSITVSILPNPTVPICLHPVVSKLRLEVLDCHEGCINGMKFIFSNS